VPVLKPVVVALGAALLAVSLSSVFSVSLRFKGQRDEGHVHGHLAVLHPGVRHTCNAGKAALMSALVILAASIFVTGLCAFGLWFTAAEIQRLCRNSPD
jgi:hypothetical protein